MKSRRTKKDCFMADMTRYCIDSDARRTATLVIAAVSAALAVMVNLMLLPFIKSSAEGFFGPDAVAIFSVVGLIAFGGVSIFAFFSLIWLLFDRWLWSKWPFCYFHGIPDLNGTWGGDLISDFKNEKGENTQVHIVLIVTQTFSRMQFRSNLDQEASNKSTASKSISSMIGIGECDINTHSFQLEYAYKNTAMDKEDDDLSWENAHRGFCHGTGNASQIEGRYFTDRHSNTQGSFKLKRKTKSRLR